MEHILLMPSINEGDKNGQATVVGIMVNIGDNVDVGDPILEIETDKVTVEIPSTHAGIVSTIHVAIDDEVGQGVECLTLSDTGSATNKPESTQHSIDTNDQPVVEPTLESVNEVFLQTPTDQNLQQTEKQFSSVNEEQNHAPALDSAIVPAGPSTRRLARELGINIADIAPAKPGFRISTDDIKAHAKLIIRPDGLSSVISAPVKQLAVPTEMSQGKPRSISHLSKFGATREESLSKIQMATSSNISHAWSIIPHAWLQDRVDITELEQWRQTQKSNGIKLTITVIIAKAIAVALKQFPKMNSSFDEQRNSIIYKDYIDVGIAVDTPHGLVVPGLRQVDIKRLVELSDDMNDLSRRANERKLTPADLQGAGITLSNLGGIGLSSIFPIVNWPQVAIIGVAGSEVVPKLINGELNERRVVTLTLGFDHRIINGAEGARFLVQIKELLEDIRLLMI